MQEDSFEYCCAFVSGLHELFINAFFEQSRRSDLSMKMRFSFSESIILRKLYPSILALSFIFGFLLGVHIAASSGTIYASLMRRALLGHVSIVSLLFLHTTPFLLTLLIFKIGRPSLILVLCIIRSFTFGAVSYSLYLTFGSTEWLIKSLMLFADICSLVALFWYWYRLLSDHRVLSISVTTISLLITVTACIVDYFLISPFLIKLLHY